MPPPLKDDPPPPPPDPKEALRVEGGVVVDAVVPRGVRGVVPPPPLPPLPLAETVRRRRPLVRGCDEE